jgi:glycosyltransferase involved in cell wall biosynthesis
MSVREMSGKEPPALSIVVPVYNERENVGLLYERIVHACGGMDPRFEVVFVDDGSDDDTYEKLADLHRRDQRVRVVRFRRNFGQTAAMSAGFEHARGNIIVSMDGDLQNDPKDIPRLLDKLSEGYDVVVGWRKDRKDKFWNRKLPSIVANFLIGLVTGIRIHDNGCSLKAYRASVIKGVRLYGEMHRFIPAMATLTGATTSEIIVSHHARRFGKSKYGIGRVWRVVLDIMTVKMIVGFSARPALWFGILSFPFITGGLFILAIAGFHYMGRSLDEWTVLSTTAFLFLFLGAHLLSMGFIAELFVKTGDYSPQKSLNPTLGELEVNG